MKNITKFFALAVVILGFSANAFAQGLTNSDEGTATATILTALTIESKVNLDFGTIGVGTGATTVILAAATGGRTGSADRFVTRPGAAGQFEIKGEPNALISISLPNNTDVTLSPDVSEGDDMTVITWNSLVGADAAISGISLGATGTVTLKVGATLNVGASQLPDTYTGTYNVTVNYD